MTCGPLHRPEPSGPAATLRAHRHPARRPALNSARRAARRTWRLLPVLALTLVLGVAAPAAADCGTAGKAGPSASGWVDRGADLVAGWVRTLLPSPAPKAEPPERPERPGTVSGTVGPVFDPDGFAPSSPPLQRTTVAEQG